MSVSRRINRLGLGVFERNDIRKQTYQVCKSNNDLPSLLDLSLGSTDIKPPDTVLHAIKNSLAQSKSSAYCLHAATEPFRESVAIWVSKRFGVNVDPYEEVLLLIGSQEGTAHLPLAVLNSGDTGLILDPSYPSHRGGLILADAHIEKLVLKAEEDWKPNFHSLTNAQLDQLKMIIFGFPHNPTAQVGDQTWLDEAMKCGVKHEVVIAHDNPYVDLCFEYNAPSLLNCPGWREWGIEFFSLSKGWCLGGFRLGFAIGAKPLINALRRVKSVVDFNQSLALQEGAIEALLNSSSWPKQVLETYKQRRDTAMKALSQLGWKVPVPSMAMYLWMPLPYWAKKSGFNDETFAADLLKKTGVALTPGSGFGQGGSDWLRLALVLPKDQLEEAFMRMESWWHVNS